nr:RHS repeat-associated core domain-containing protein [Paracidovorax avenae]
MRTGTDDAAVFTQAERPLALAAKGDVQALSFVEQPLRFQGQYFDGETGLHYNRHRYYDPVTGRFVHQDPIGLDGGVNLFVFAPNPLEWIDPYGLVKFTKKTKGLILDENEQFFGVKKCEKCKCQVQQPKKSQKGVTPPQDEWQIDHIDPESAGGPATEVNGQVLCRKCNREDWYKKKPNYKKRNRLKKKKSNKPKGGKCDGT